MDLLALASHAPQHFLDGEGKRNELTERQTEDAAILRLFADDVHVVAELAEKLAAVTARPRVGALGSVDRDSQNRVELVDAVSASPRHQTVGHRVGDRRLFSMDGLRVAAVLDVEAGVNLPVEREHRGADVELRVGLIGVFAGLLGGIDNAPVERFVSLGHLDHLGQLDRGSGRMELDGPGGFAGAVTRTLTFFVSHCVFLCRASLSLANG